MKGDFQKYNNNAGYVIDGDMRKESQLSQAFSHFTWQYSQGNCMVVDLQGTEDGQLTDPQIHTLKKTKKFGQGDLGYEGILRFFRSHTCTSFCEGLNLTHPKMIRDLRDNYQFEDFHGLQKLQNEKLQKLKEKFNIDSGEAAVPESAVEADEEKGKGEVLDSEGAVIAAVEDPTKIEIKLPDFGDEPMVHEVKKFISCEEYAADVEGLFGIDDFFRLDIDEKLLKEYVPYDKEKIEASRAKRGVIIAASTTAAVKDATVDASGHKEDDKDCTKLICSLCKKVGEYNTKLLLSTKRKLNQLICTACTDLADKADKMAFDCSLCKNDFEISSYILKMKRIDKASRCEKCSLF